MTEKIKREELEELLLSLTLQLANEDDLNTINTIYNDYQNKKNIFTLSKTELYFKQFIITYCQANCDDILKQINCKDRKISDTFKKNFYNSKIAKEYKKGLKQLKEREINIEELNPINKSYDKEVKKPHAEGVINLCNIAVIIKDKENINKNNSHAINQNENANDKSNLLHSSQVKTQRELFKDIMEFPKLIGFCIFIIILTILLVSII